MTGYGRGEAAGAGVSVVVELRSVNNRFRDIQLRTPREYMALEPRINSVIREPFSRGRIDAFVRRHHQGAKTRLVADEALARSYAEVISELLGKLDGLVSTEIPATFILSQPGVLETREEEVDVMAEWDVVEAALTGAVNDLIQMRKTEGKALYKDLGSHLAEMRTLIAEVEAALTGINERLRTKLEGRMARFLNDRYDPQRIVQEAAILADKADVNEELARLRSHCEQFAEGLEAEEPVGRRLDFLLQEMNREVNTIGSKAAEHPVSQRVVTMKSVLERMREQAANVE